MGEKKFLLAVLCKGIQGSEKLRIKRPADIYRKKKIHRFTVSLLMIKKPAPRQQFQLIFTPIRVVIEL